MTKNKNKNENGSTSQIEFNIKKDFKIAFQIYRQNLKTFILFGLFIGLGTILISGILGFLITIFAFNILDSLDLEFTEQIGNVISLIISGPTFVVMFILFGSMFGLAYDIMSSGDEFAEIRGAFTYFRNRWKQYCAIGLLAGWINIIMGLYFNQINPSIIEFSTQDLFLTMILISSLGWLWYMSFVISMASGTKNGSTKKALKENFHILKNQKKRVYLIGLIYLCIMTLPNTLIMIYNLQGQADSLAFIGRNLLFIVLIAIYAFCFLHPILALVITRIYNTSAIGLEDFASEERDIVIQKRF